MTPPAFHIKVQKYMTIGKTLLYKTNKNNSRKSIRWPAVPLPYHSSNIWGIFSFSSVFPPLPQIPISWPKSSLEAQI